MEQQQQHTHIWNATNQTENSGYFVVVRSLATFTFYFFFSTFYFKHLCVCTFQKTATFKIRKKKKRSCISILKGKNERNECKQPSDLSASGGQKTTTTTKKTFFVFVMLIA